MVQANEETERRRSIQIAYNQMHGITPQPIFKKSSNAILSFLDVSRRLNATELKVVDELIDEIPLEQIPQLISQLERQMQESAKKLEFEEAANLRDRIKHLRDKMLGN